MFKSKSLQLFLAFMLGGLLVFVSFNSGLVSNMGKGSLTLRTPDSLIVNSKSVPIYLTDENSVLIGDFKYNYHIQVLGSNRTENTTRLRTDGPIEELTVRHGSTFKVDFNYDGINDFNVKVEKDSKNFSSIVLRVTPL